MTFTDFKTLTAYHLKEDGKQPTDEIMGLLIYEAICRIATVCVPMKLYVALEDSMDSSTVFRIADSKTYIRMPSSVYTLTDDIDIDEELVIAVIYLVCSQITIKYEKKSAFDSMASNWIGQYNANFNRFQYED